MRNDSFAAMYLGGFANRHQTEFLRKVIAHNPDVRYEIWRRSSRFLLWPPLSRLSKMYILLHSYYLQNQTEFLRKVIAHNPDVRYEHFGDIDIGGFLIHKHLCREASKDFELYLPDCSDNGSIFTTRQNIIRIN